MLPARRATALLAVLVGLACTGGQSGTETPNSTPAGGADGGAMGGPHTKTGLGGRETEDITLVGTEAVASCACTLAGRGALLRGRLLELSGCELRVRVEELLAKPPELVLRVGAGDVVTARRVAGGCSEVPALATGDEVLVVYAEPAGAEAGEALVASWSEQFVFGSARGEPVALPRSELSALLDAETCAKSFPQSEAPPATLPKPPAPACDKP